MQKKIISERGKRNRMISLILLLAILIVLAFGISYCSSNKNTSPTIKNKSEIPKEDRLVETMKITENDHINLSVPLISQLDEPSLYNGCEVASLAMLLQYNGFDIDKNELAEKITTVDLESNGLHGDPNDGFVGSITGNEGEGYSAYSPVMIELAEEVIDSNFTVVDLTDKDFDAILVELMNEHPVWVITTTHFTAPNEIETWETANGNIDVSWEVHSVALTGFDADSIYLNDPYGEKQKVDRDDFIDSWEQMGSQAMTIIPATS